MEDKRFHLGNPISSVPASDTPSSVGDIEAAVPPSFPETAIPLSVRAEEENMAHSHTAVHHAHADSLLHSTHLAHDGTGIQTIQPSALTVGDVEVTQPGAVRLGPAEFALTLPMDSRIKDDYERVISDGASTMQEYLTLSRHNSRTPSSDRDSLQSKVYEIIARLNNVTTHPDLNIPEHLAAGDSGLESQAKWAEYSSSKFLLLGYLIELASTHELHIIIAVQNDQKQTIIERYLRGKGFTYTRPREELGGNLEVSLAKGPLSFGVHSNGNVRDMFRAPCAILVFDTAFNPSSPAVEYIRRTYTRNGGLLPVIWLFISNTCEHVERCLPDTTESERLRLLLQYTARLHGEAGDLQHDALNVQEDAEEIVNYLLHSFASWQLPMVESLNFAPSEESDQTSSSDESQVAAQKRSLPDDDKEDNTSKRARVDLPGTSTQSTKDPSQSLEDELHHLEANLVQMKSNHTVEKEQLKHELNQWQSRYQDKDRSLSSLQYRYENRKNELHKVRQERDKLEASKKSMEQRTEKSKEDVTKLKEERSQLKKELEEARQELKNGGGSLAELEAAREEIRLLKKDAISLERKADYEKNQAEYTREQYQNASNAAAQAGNELRQLQAENESLKLKADNNSVQLRGIVNASDSATHISRIEELELMLASRNDLLRRKEEELREIRKNRPSTRSTSTQPRSPKWAASSRPTSPGVNNGNGNGNGNGGLAGRGSGLRFSSEVLP
ncbi:uncharacterized protein N7484_003417 [Penicillium longicatenatum]|uniref:uncharacterized protein n=1 Tax=Penicillium longicatenatum TaxID=1561947 RepID=UPI002548C85F|nr:uncharacterized protein N7484_003417 [Penicillium longicatenatum]KAJ5649694.1 hypothetical protein N7484_003417 [Penicillium longicatenatum]